jgi:hypothetical protein
MTLPDDQFVQREPLGAGLGRHRLSLPLLDPCIEPRGHTLRNQRKGLIKLADGLISERAQLDQAGQLDVHGSHLGCQQHLCGLRVRL